MRPELNPNRPILILAAGLALALALTPAAIAGSERDVDRTIEAPDGATIEIENTAGSVRVRGWDQQQVRVTGTLGENVEELVVEIRRGRVVIEVDAPDRRGWRHNDIDTRLEIMVPKSARVDVQTVSASIDVEQFEGRLEAESVSGSIEVDGSLSAAELETVSGSIRMRGANTRTIAETVSGSIRLEGVSDRVEASSVSGSVEVDAGEIERGEIDSVSGRVELTCSLKRGASLDIGSHSGNVTLRLPADVSADFEATTFSGSIENDFGPQPERNSRWVPSQSLEFTTGDGSAEVTLETFSGSLRIVRR